MRWFLALALCVPVFGQGLAADLLWTARYVVTPEGVIENGAVAIEANRIVGVGTAQQMAARYDARERRDQPDAILAPGLVNTHTHAAMSLFRGIANDRKLEDWLQNFIFPAEAMNVDREFVRWGTRLAALEMALSGTTTFTDMYYFEDTVAEVTKEAGLRGVLGQSVIGFPAPDYKTPGAQLDAVDTFLTKWANDPLVVPAVAPHAIYTTPDDLLKSARELADKHLKPLLIHLSETKTEFDEAVMKRGMTPAATLSSLGLLGPRTVAAHAVWLEDDDIALLAASRTGVAHNPSSNMMLASGIARVIDLLEAGVNVGLGTDGVAGSNNDHSMFEEMDLAAKLQKVARNDPTALSAKQVFEMATMGGARVLGMGNVIGSIEAGKMADIISVRVTEPHAVPVYDVMAQLVYALKGSDVTDVMVNGAWVVRDAKMLTLNREEILKKAAEYRAKISGSLVPPK